MFIFLKMSARDNRHVIYLRSDGENSVQIDNLLARLRPNEISENFKIYKVAGRDAPRPPNVRGFPTIFYMNEHGKLVVFEGGQCVSLVSQMCTELIKGRKSPEPTMQQQTIASRPPGRVPPLLSESEKIHGGRGESFSEELFKTRHLQNRPNEPGVLQADQLLGNQKVKESDLAAWEAARIAADRALEGQFGTSDAGPGPSHQSQQAYQPGNRMH